MNIVRLTITAIVLSGILIGCKEEFDPASQLRPSLTGVYLKASQTNFNHSSAASFTDNFTVECSNTSWQFTTTPDWLSISPTSGNASSSIVLEGKENTSTDPRTSLSYLESVDVSEKISKLISVSQGGVESTLTVEPTELSFKGGGESKSILVIANCEWNAKCSQDWISLTKVDSNELSIQANANPSDSYRNATVYIAYGDNKTANISITQFPTSISSSEMTLKFGNSAGKYEILVNSEIEWTAMASDSWIMVDPSAGPSGESRVSIEVAPNGSVSDREGYVAFKTGDYERFQIALVQEGAFINSIPELTFRAVESSQEVEIQSNTSWEVLSSPDWLSFSQSSGTGNSHITVTAVENPSSSSRSGKIEIGQRGLSLSCEINVVQSGRTLEAGTTLLEFNDKAGVQTFALSSDGAWTSVCSNSWFTADPVAGNGDETITVSVEENTDEKEREGYITYSFGNQSAQVWIKQSGKYFNVDSDAFDFDSHGGSHAINLSTNEKWTAEILESPEWLSVSSTSGEGAAEIVITVNDNPSVNSRTAEVVITPENSQAISIKVSQAARYLRISSENITFFSEGGTSGPITIDTDGTYEIISEESWFRVDENESSGFTVIAESYKQPDTRTGKITISLTDLEEGSLSLEIAVIQIGEGCSFIVDGYTEDKNWSDFGNSALSFSIVGFTADQSWDSTQHPTVSIIIEGYKGLDSWDSKEDSNIDFNIDKFGSIDEVWNTNESENLDFNIDQFGSTDESWNTDKTENIEFNTDQYGDIESWNTNQEEIVDFGITEYTPDINWNEE